MKKIRWITSLLCVFLFFGCSSAKKQDPPKDEPPAEDNIKPVAEADEGTWTLCLYLCGSNLESRQGWATKTIKEITGADIPDNVNVVIETGGSGKWRNDDVNADEISRFLVSEGKLEKLGSPQDVSMGEPDTLKDFLLFCQSKYPAGHTAVVLWDHGGGPLEGACYDENNDFDSLTLSEMDEAFAAGVLSRDGKKYDIVGFDACLMGSLETAAMLSDDADILVASEEIESGAGWDYTIPLTAMGTIFAPEEIATQICDGYMKKCESRKKGSAATLSAIDLSKVQDIRDAVLAAIDSLSTTSGSKLGALRRMAYGSRSAEGFGGATKEEGMSNLIDLKGMAVALSADTALNGEGWDKVAEAVDDAVIENVSGAAVSGANGISIWYPRAFVRSELSDYVYLSPLTGYASTLDDYFKASLGQIAFSDSGSVDDDGKFSVTIAPEAHSSFYNLYVVNRRTDGDYMDKNVDIYDDWESLTFKYDCSGAVRITLDGMTLDAQVIDYDTDRMIFSCPVQINGEDRHLRIAWIWDTYESGHYELLGVWDGVDADTGLVDRMQDELLPGDVVGAISLSTGELRGSITVASEPVIDEAPMEPGEYECYFAVIDLHGNETSSDVLRYRVDERGETTVIP